MYSNRSFSLADWIYLLKDTEIILCGLRKIRETLKSVFHVSSVVTGVGSPVQVHTVG